MSDVIKKNIGNAEFTFYVNSRDNRSGFVHECELYAGIRRIASRKVQYYNRTWECYRYQTVMLECVCDAKEQARERIIEQEKEKRGWSKLTAARREEVEKIIAADDGMKVLEALYDSVKQAQYGTEAERDELNRLDALLAIVELLFGREKEIA